MTQIQAVAELECGQKKVAYILNEHEVIVIIGYE